MSLPTIVTRDEWLAARKELLAREKELTRERDAINAARRRLPMVEITEDYRFAGPKGDIRRCTINDEPRLCRYPSGGTVAIAVILGIAAIVVFVYLYGKKAGAGQSWGLKAMNIRLVDQRTGAPIGTGRAIGRYFARYLSAVVCYLGFLWMLWDKDRQTWHDKLVQSVVIRA